MRHNQYPSCCGIWVINSFGKYTEERGEHFKNEVDTILGDFGPQISIQVALADYQLGVEDSSFNRDELADEFSDGNGVWTKEDSWLPALKDEGFEFLYRSWNDGHESEVFVFHLPTNRVDHKQPPEGWDN